MGSVNNEDVEVGLSTPCTEGEDYLSGLTITAVDIHHDSGNRSQLVATDTSEQLFQENLASFESKSARIFILEELLSLNDPGINFRSAFDIWDLRNLWDPPPDKKPRPFWLDFNVSLGWAPVRSAFDSDLPYRYREHEKNLTVLRNDASGKHKWEFWPCHCAVSSKILADDKVQIDCKISVAPLALGDGWWRSDYRSSPLKEHLLRILSSQGSATRIQYASPAACVMSIAIDILRAVIECSAIFMSDIEDLDTLSTTSEAHEANYIALQSLRMHPRNIGLAFRHTYASLISIMPDADCSRAGDMFRLEALKLETDAKLERLQNRVDDLLGTMEARANLASRIQAEDETRSVKRLTALATIFLPLGLATSLLSMGTRLMDLGLLWYDFFTISVTLAFILVFIHASMHIFQWTSEQKPDTWVIFVTGVEFLIWLLSTLTAQALGWYLIIGLGTVIVTTFWIGVTLDTSLGLQVLGYGAAAIVAIRVWLSVVRAMIKFIMKEDICAFKYFKV